MKQVICNLKRFLNTTFSYSLTLKRVLFNSNNLMSQILCSDDDVSTFTLQILTESRIVKT